MNCINHPDRPGVTTCVQCATGMCPECVGNGLTIDSKALCANCAPGTLKNAIKQLKAQLWRSKLKFYLSAGVLAIGLIYAAQALLGNDPYGSSHALFSILFALGVIGAISVMNRQEANIDGGLLLTSVGRPDAAMTYGCLTIVVSFLIGMVIAPLNMYRYFTTYRSCQKTIREYEALLAPFSAAPAGT